MAPSPLRVLGPTPCGDQQELHVRRLHPPLATPTPKAARPPREPGRHISPCHFVILSLASFAR